MGAGIAAGFVLVRFRGIREAEWASGDGGSEAGGPGGGGSGVGRSGDSSGSTVSSFGFAVVFCLALVAAASGS
ncbi:MAG: hypothetical protein F4Z50_01465 [Gemmatimonadetes bacterium]|nr:hypothetical protein [Gemmatimonadota bacterium]MYI38704.1 hypothetical protein [Acidobacteriota bacterium]